MSDFATPDATLLFIRSTYKNELRETRLGRDTSPLIPGLIIGNFLGILETELASKKVMCDAGLAPLFLRVWSPEG